MAEDPQKLKKIAAASYDYENDSRWATYWSNILIPPHMASRTDVIDHYKRRFYQRYIDPDLVVEPMASSSSSQTPKPSSTSSTSAREQPRQQNSGSSTRTTGASATPAATPSSLRWDRQTIQFSVNAWVFIVAVLAILPIVPKSLSNRAFRLAFMGSTCSSLYSIYSLYGKPRAWNLQALQVWFQSVLATKDFIYFLYCLTFVTSNLQIKFALIPVLCRTLEHAAKFLRRNFGRSSLYRKYLDEPCLWVESNTTTLGILTSHAEIGLGFLLIISLFSWQRNIIQTFMYWQILKLMYHVPATSGYHQSAWAKISQSVTPLIDRYAPFLHTPISAIQKWWFRMATTTNLPEQQQQQRPAIYPQAVSSGAWHSSGSVGPFFIVISVIAVLAVLSCLVSRFCVGSRTTRPLDTRYSDFFWWVRKRCSCCTSSHDVELGAKVAVNVSLPNKNGKTQGTETVSL